MTLDMQTVTLAPEPKIFNLEQIGAQGGAFQHSFLHSGFPARKDNWVRHLAGTAAEVGVADKAHDMSPEQAADIAALFRKIYGENYVEPEFESPALLSEKVASGEWIACMLYSPAGDLMAHAALLPGADGHVEGGRLVVGKEWRGRHLAEAVVELSSESLSQLPDCKVFWSDCVTKHVASQRVYANAGQKPAGLYFGKYTDFFACEQRESVLYLASVLDDGIKKERMLFVPPAMADLCALSADSLGVSRAILPLENAGEHLPFGSTLTLDLRDKESFGLAVIKAPQAVSPQVALEAVKAQIADGAKALLFKINVSEPQGAILAAELQKNGFIFGGVEPHSDYDLLVMQHSMVLEGLDTDQILLVSEVASQLKEGILEQYRNACGQRAMAGLSSKAFSS